MHPLDRPVWNALHSGWSALAMGDACAMRLNPDYGPFAAAADGSAEAQPALAALVAEGGEIWLPEIEEAPPPPGTVVLRTAPLAQLVCDNFAPISGNVEIIDLTEADAPEMRALAHLTEPGPFYALTHRLGDFVGVREGGLLIAMAGERMHIGDYREVSAVCTHPDHRSRGLAGALMSTVMARMIAKGQTPFLHSYAYNAGAIALYERLGFRTRREMVVTVLGRE